jgi:rhombotail lipoprotein
VKPFDALIENLDSELARFQQKVADNPAVVQLSTRSGYTGAGSLSGLFTVFLVFFGGFGLWMESRSRS